MYLAPAPVEPMNLTQAAILLTRPDQAPALQWIVDTSLLGEELIAFHAETLGGRGSMVQHEPVRGAPRGYTELRVPVSEVPADVVERLPRRIHRAIASLSGKA